MGTNLLGRLKSKNCLLRVLIDFWYVLLIILVIFAVVVAISFSQNTEDDEDLSEDSWIPNDGLIFAHTICRHGDRNIFAPYKNDPWRDPKHWPEGFRQLTKIGKQQHFELGQYLRERYAKLLGNGDYSGDKVFIHSTDTDRALMSAQVCMASLFPPHGDQIWQSGLSWQPVPVHTMPRHQDYLLSPEKSCDRYAYEMIQYANSSEYKSVFEKNDALIKYLEENSGETLNQFKSINSLYEVLHMEQLKGKTLPIWAEKVMESDSGFEKIKIFANSIYTKSTYFKRIRSGYLLKEILDRSTNKTMSMLSPDRTMVLYFAHSNTLNDMLNSLGLQQPHVPPVASCLFFELYKTQSEYYIQLFYRKSAEKNVAALEIPNCGATTKCPLNEWYELYKDILPTESYEKECELSDGKIASNYVNPEHFTESD